MEGKIFFTTGPERRARRGMGGRLNAIMDQWRGGKSTRLRKSLATPRFTIDAAGIPVRSAIFVVTVG